jgi:hypothetical protein
MRFCALALVAAVLVALPAAAQAPDDLPPIEVDVDARVIPNKAGTPSDPQGVRVIVDAELVSPLGVERPILQSGTVLFPKGGRWNGAKYPTCSEATLNRRGLRACPRGSIFGKGIATGFADEVITRPRITVVNGGAKRVYFFTELTNPALVEMAVVGKIKRRTGKWSYQLDFTVPEQLQIVAGVPITVTKLHIEAGRGDILATTYCPPSRRWPYESTLELSDGRGPFIEGSTPCRR